MATSSETLDLFFAFGPEVAPPPDHPWARFYAAGEHSELLKEYAQTLENASGEELSTEAGAFSAASALAVFLQVSSVPIDAYSALGIKFALLYLGRNTYD